MEHTIKRNSFINIPVQMQSGGTMKNVNLLINRDAVTFAYVHPSPEFEGKMMIRVGGHDFLSSVTKERLNSLLDLPMEIGHEGEDE